MDMKGEIVGQSFSSKLIHEADPQSRSVVITIFARVVCSSVRPLFKILQNKTTFKRE